MRLHPQSLSSQYDGSSRTAPEPSFRQFSYFQSTMIGARQRPVSAMSVCEAIDLGVEGNRLIRQTPSSSPIAVPKLRRIQTDLAPAISKKSGRAELIPEVPATRLPEYALGIAIGVGTALHRRGGIHVDHKMSTRTDCIRVSGSTCEVGLSESVPLPTPPSIQVV